MDRARRIREVYETYGGHVSVMKLAQLCAAAGVFSSRRCGGFRGTQRICAAALAERGITPDEGLLRPQDVLLLDAILREPRKH